MTCHAGEGSDESSADNVTCAVNELGCRRIGHGVAALFHGRALDCLNEVMRASGESKTGEEKMRRWSSKTIEIVRVFPFI